MATDQTEQPQPIDSTHTHKVEPLLRANPQIGLINTETEFLLSLIISGAVLATNSY